jgi:hypothetical protein
LWVAVDEEIVLSFVRNAIKSVWALELLLLVRREPQQLWSRDALVRELRGSTQLVDTSLAILNAAGLISIGGTGVRYEPRSAELAELVNALFALHAVKPITVVQTIFTAPNERIRSFSDAFLFRKK